MSFLKSNQDELLDGFCRACLQKYDDPADLLHYTEKNRRLFIYSTGLQVKRKDTLTFQICKGCYMNMKISCKFKKQCRSSDRRFRSFLRMKEVGGGPDLVTFLGNSSHDIQFPLLCGNSTPVNQKKDDDNESTCTSIRNFMTDILQGEEMADTEARIIKEVIEEEADLLEDSLDSHWLQDENSIDSDYRLDFSFSPYVTPRSVNNSHSFTPIRQIEPSLKCKNNHAKKVLLQLPTSRFCNDDPLNVIDNDKTELQDNNFKQNRNNLVEGTIDHELGVKYTTEDSIAELIQQNEDFLIRDETNDAVNSIALKTFDRKDKSEEHDSIIDNDIIDSDSNTFNAKSHLNKNVPLTENDIAVKSITLNSFHMNSGDNSFKGSLREKDVESKCFDSNAFEIEARLGKDKYNLIETDRAVRSISLSGFGTENEYGDNNERPSKAQNKSAVKIINSSHLEDLNELQSIKTTSSLAEKDFTIVTIAHEHKENDLPMNETDTAVESISLNTAELESDPLAVKSLDIKVLKTELEGNNLYSKNYFAENDLAHKSISVSQFEVIPESHATEFSITGTDLPIKSINLSTFETQTQDSKDDNVINDLLEENLKVTENHEQDPLFVSINEEHQNKQSIVDTIDKNLQEALKNQTNQDFSLDDLLVSPTGDRSPLKSIATPIKERLARVSTPIINNILFGEKLDDDIKPEEEVDVLEEFFKEGVKEFDPKTPNPELPLELKYDLQNAECKMCNKKFFSTSSLKLHLNRVHFIRFPRKKTERIDGVCKICGKIVDTRNMAKHIRTHNKKLNEYKCDLCNLTFQLESSFKYHLKVHDHTRKTEESVSAKRYICSTCGAGFTASSNLAMHNRRHTTNYKFTCEICDKGFFRASEFKIHTRRLHTKERPYECKQCDGAFVVKYELYKHIETTHADEKNYECHHCGKKFVSKMQITIHFRKSKKCKLVGRRQKKPKAKKPRLKCPHCPLTFSYKYGLVKHQNTSACWEIIQREFQQTSPFNGALFMNKKNNS